MGVQKVVKQVGGAGKGGPQGTYFERLQAVADLRYDDSADDAAHQLVLDKISTCEDLVHKYAQTNGFRSQEVRSAIDEWARSFLADLGATRDQLRDGRDVVVQARGVMRQARDLFQANVSDELLTGGERGGASPRTGRARWPSSRSPWWARWPWWPASCTGRAWRRSGTGRGRSTART